MAWLLETQLPPTKVGGVRLRPPPTKSEQTVAGFAKTIFTERALMLMAFKTLNAPALAGGFNRLIDNKCEADTLNLLDEITNWHCAGFIVSYTNCKPAFTGIDIMDKTVKIRAYSGDEKGDVPQSNLTDDQNKSLELAKKNAQLEEEKKKSLDQSNIIEQLRDSLKQEQAKMAEMVKKPVGLDANELAVKDAQLEEEKIRSLENLKTIVQLRESLKQEQAKSAEMAKKMAELEVNEHAMKNAKLQEEKIKSLELFKLAEQLRESLKQEQSKMAEMAKRMSEQEARTKESAVLEAKVKELTEAISMIAGIAATGKTG